MRLQRAIFVLLLLAVAIQIAYFHPKMPEKMALHFGADGRPNGWMHRDGFVMVYVFVLALMAAIFFVLPKFLIKIPDQWINLPHKDYWLAPERRAQTGQTIEKFMNECGNATLAFMLCVFQMAFSANLEPGANLPDWVWVLLAAFLGFMGVWLFRFYRAFRLPPGTGNRTI
ncbi:MAG: DUF1648 domain-containing protein [Deltaproteobacteria bacterium]|nr:DUF1648 domain-containing protein [Deltaproteobacteria bacterium]